MKAALIYNYGDVECIRVEDIAKPEPCMIEAVVAVRCAALNHLDIWVRKGRGSKDLKMPHVLGSDASGVVVEVGSQTHGFKAGDEVIINPAISCGCCEYCQKGDQSMCSRFDIVGLNRWGTFAEKVVVPFYNLWPKPPNTSFEEAAALPLAYQTAWRMLMTKGKLKPGQTVLIHGIGGGVAIAALQFAKPAGGITIITSSSDQKLNKAKEFGADYVINYKTEKDIASAVKDVTKGRGVDVIIDTVGAATWDANFSMIRRGGKIVICGVTTGAIAQTDLHKLYWNQVIVMGSRMGSNEDFREMLNAVATLKIKPVIDSVFPLEDVKKAVNRMEKGEQLGKIVLKVSS